MCNFLDIDWSCTSFMSTSGTQFILMKFHFYFLFFCINWISIKKQGLSYGFSALLMECYVFHPTLTYFVTKCPEVWELKQLKHKELVCQFFVIYPITFFMIPSLLSLIGWHDMTFHAEWALATANGESTKEGN